MAKLEPMKILVTGAAGFVGSRLVQLMAEHHPDWSLVGIDNLSRKGSEQNLGLLADAGVRFIHGDVRCAEDVEELPSCDWILDCAANPSVLAGLNGGAAQVVQHNLAGTLHLLEKCRRNSAGFIMLSTSRVYSIAALSALPMQAAGSRLEPLTAAEFPEGFTARGVNERFSTQAPISLYGATKLASEIMALEYGETYNFPVWVNRCGVLAGAGQFGKIDQGIFSFWIYQWLAGRPLAYIGFGGQGRQVRDLFSPQDLFSLIQRQIADPARPVPRTLNVGGGRDCSLSLQEVSRYCEARFGSKTIESQPATRKFDIPYYITDATLAAEAWDWRPQMTPTQILDDIADWAEAHRELVDRGF